MHLMMKLLNISVFSEFLEQERKVTIIRSYKISSQLTARLNSRSFSRTIFVWNTQCFCLFFSIYLFFTVIDGRIPISCHMNHCFRFVSLLHLLMMLE